MNLLEALLTPQETKEKGLLPSILSFLPIGKKTARVLTALAEPQNLKRIFFVLIGGYLVVSWIRRFREKYTIRIEIRKELESQLEPIHEKLEELEEQNEELLRQNKRLQESLDEA